MDFIFVSIILIGEKTPPCNCEASLPEVMLRNADKKIPRRLSTALRRGKNIRGFHHRI